MNCPHCNALLDVPSEVLRGITVAVCSQCGEQFGPAAPKRFKPSERGRPSRPGGLR